MPELSQKSAALRRFEAWLQSDADVLAANGWIDMHIDVAVPGGTRAQWVDASVALFAEIVLNPPSFMEGMTLMLVIRLTPSRVPRVTPPPWSEVLADDVATPPSLYLMQEHLRQMPWAVERTVSPIEFPIAGVRSPGTFMCWRRPDDPPEDGWECDLRFEYPPLPLEGQEGVVP
jgi:hypothetical protein